MLSRYEHSDSGNAPSLMMNASTEDEGASSVKDHQPVSVLEETAGLPCWPWIAHSESVDEGGGGWVFGRGLFKCLLKSE